MALVANSIVDFVVPPRCAFCAASADSRLCCRLCEAIIPRNEIACPRCANPVPSRLPDGVCCGACQTREPPFRAAAAPLLYEFPIDEAIKAIKFRRHLFYLPVFADLLADVVRQRFSNVDLLVPVPLHRTRHALRGFNQATELCRIVGRRCGLPVAGNVRRVRATKPQSGLTASERRGNLRKAFAVSGPVSGPVSRPVSRQPRFHRPLIIDDVMTTGETCRSLSNVLLAAGADEVCVLTIARAQSD